MEKTCQKPVRLDRSTGVEVWRHDFVPDSGYYSPGIDSIAADSRGDVIANNRLGSARGDTVLKFSGADGHEVWRYPGGVYVPCQVACLDDPFAPRVVGVDAADDAIAAGNHGSGYVEVVKLHGYNGTLIWRHTAGGPDYVGAIESAVIVPPGQAGAGDVVYAAQIAGGNSSVRPDLVVRRLRGNDGTVVWEYVRPEGAGFDALPLAIGPDGSIAVGNETDQDGRWVIKLDASGTFAWRRQLGSVIGQVAVGSTGDVVAVAFPGVQVAKWAGLDGTPVWTASYPSGTGWTLAVATNGDSIVGGASDVVALSGVDGTELWRSGSGLDSSYALVTTAAGNLIAAGRSGVGSGDSHYLVTKLVGTDGSDFTGQPECGDGAIEAPEVCDDGNLDSVDG